MIAQLLTGVLTNLVKVNAKAIVAFVVTILAQAVLDALSGHAPLPTTAWEWVRYLGTALLVGLGVYSVPNKLTPKQVAKSDAIEAVASTATQAVKNVITETADTLSDTLSKTAAKTAVPALEQLSNQVGDAINSALDQLRKGVRLP